MILGNQAIEKLSMLSKIPSLRNLLPVVLLDENSPALFYEITHSDELSPDACYAGIISFGMADILVFRLERFLQTSYCYERGLNYWAVYRRAARRGALLEDPETKELYIRLRSIADDEFNFKAIVTSCITAADGTKNPLYGVFGYLNPHVLHAFDYIKLDTWIQKLLVHHFAVPLGFEDKVLIVITEKPLNLFEMDFSDDELNSMYESAYINKNLLIKEASDNEPDILLMYKAEAPLFNKSRRPFPCVKIQSLISRDEFLAFFKSSYSVSYMLDEMFYRDKFFLREPLARSIRQRLTKKLEHLSYTALAV